MRKYRNVPTVVDGIKFSSKAEARRYGELKLLEKAGQIYALTLQNRYKLEVNGQKICTYVADFSYRSFEKHSDWIVEDVKSPATITPVYKLKRALMKACLGIEITEIE